MQGREESLSALTRLLQVILVMFQESIGPCMDMYTLDGSGSSGDLDFLSAFSFCAIHICIK